MISVYNAKRALTATALIIAISGCASQVERLPILYKPEIRQGTLITEAGITQLEMGMTPSQVRFLLGPPTLEDPFSDNRWDYVYEVEPRSADVEAVSRRLSVFLTTAY
jgi:Small protein A (tmRNA-binding)